ncbi:MAG: acetylglutamate kinase [Clostridiales Family XIII bacterium]|jgi:acetylglutamate kinase|nr:acetylglutamate kinase [Clostridiales Family XIII bacterium]
MNTIFNNNDGRISTEDTDVDVLRAEAAICAGKNIVVKYGGAAMSNDAYKRAAMRDVAMLSQLGIKITLVHGGGPEIDSMLNKMGKKAVFIDGLRYTDAETLDIVCMTLAGKVNKELVGLICAAGGRAVGLCGADGAVLRVGKRRGQPDLGFVGDIRQTDTALLEMLLSGGFIPVLATIGADDTGSLFNINADTAAAAVAVALRAEKLISMTDVKGVLDTDGSTIKTIRAGEARRLIDCGAVSGGMIPKVECCAAAVEGGLKEAVVIDGRVSHAVLRALSRDGEGTKFVKC